MYRLFNFQYYSEGKSIKIDRTACQHTFSYLGEKVLTLDSGLVIFAYCIKRKN